MSQDGILIVVVTIDKETGLVVSGPDIVSRGFVYLQIDRLSRPCGGEPGTG
ncbi:MAG: hypothetical protein QMD99_06885 [Rhizobiaceae bacterium]|nr:hypothetical protein [Rhizobiaceae bacterium]